MANDLRFGIQLRADGKGFVGEMRASGQAVRDFARDAKAAGQEVQAAGQQIETGLTGAVAIGATIGTVLGTAVVRGAAALKNLAAESIQTLDNLDEMSRGVMIAADRLSSMEITARAAGVGSGQLTQAIMQLNRRVADANGGNERAARLFREMGIEIADATGKLRATDDILGDVANAFAGYTESAEKSRLAQELFGRAGSKFLAYLSDGEQGLTRFTGATREQIDEAARLTAETDKLSASWERFKFTLGGFAAEALNPIAEEINRIDWGRVKAADGVLATIRALGEESAKAARQARQLKEALKLGDGTYSNEGRGRERSAPTVATPKEERTTRTGSGSRAQSAEERERAAALREAQRAYEAAEAAVARYDDQIARANVALLDGNRAMREQIEEIGLSAQQVDELRAARLEDAIATKEQTLALMSLAGERSEDIAALTREIELLRERAGLMRTGSLRRQGEATRGEIDEAARRSIDEQKEAADEVGRLLGDSLMRGFESGENAGKVFLESLGNLIMTRLSQKLAQSIIDGIANGMSGSGGGGGAGWGEAIGDIFISVFGMHSGGIAGRGGSFSRRVPASVFAGAPRYHGGGVADGEVPAILQRGEGVFTADQMARLQPAGGAVKVEIHNNAGASVSTRERQGSDGLTLEVLIEAVEGAIASNVSRGRGTLGAAMGSRFGLRQAVG